MCVPYLVKSIAIRDACIAVREAKRRYRETGKVHEVKFRSRKSPVQSVYIPATAIKDRGVYHTMLGDMRYAEALPSPVKDSRLVLRDGRYHLHVSTEAPVQQVENQGRIVALDPGVRTFQTFYAEEAVGQFGDRACGRIQRLCQHLDNLLSKADAAPHHRKRNLYRAASRIRGVFSVEDLATMATSTGCRSLGWADGGVLKAAAPADFATVGLDSVRLAGIDDDSAMPSMIFAATAGDVHHLVVDGRVVVRRGVHTSIDVASELRAAVHECASP